MIDPITIVLTAAAAGAVSSLLTLVQAWLGSSRPRITLKIGSKNVDLLVGGVTENLVNQLQSLLERDQQNQKVFLSYSHLDREFAARLVSDLESKGIHVWFDQKQIQVGDSLTSRLTDGMASCRWIIVILSPEAESSSGFKNELQLALDQEQRRELPLLLPVMYKGEHPPIDLADRVYADFRHDYGAGLDVLLRSIRRQESGEFGTAS